MNLTVEKLKSLWNKKDEVLSDELNSKFCTRFDSIKTNLDTISKIDESLINSVIHEKSFFGPAIDGITKGSDEGGGKQGIANMKKKFDGYQDEIEAICQIINVPNRIAKYRVFSNAQVFCFFLQK